jgi:hypothetical protein
MLKAFVRDLVALNRLIQETRLLGCSEGVLDRFLGG